MAILAVNAGSSTLKFALYPRQGVQVGDSLLSGTIQGLEPGGQPTLDWERQGRKTQQSLRVGADDVFGGALGQLVELLAAQQGLPAVEAVAHRVVHGGADLVDSVAVDDALMAQLAQLNSLAPLHQPHNLQGIRAFRQVYPQLPQVACFDTGFHATIGPLEHRYALPEALYAQGVRRYGFHGLSYRFIIGALQQASARAQGRVLMAHLGNGASLCAAIHGHSVASTMGFSALDGLMMGTRSGAIDPGVLLYLLEQGWDPARLQALLYRQSGLLGVSGLSADMRRLRTDGGEAAQLAIAMFGHRVVREAGAMVACLEGLDVLAFSGGIGEHDQVLRAEVCQRLAWLGLRLDEAANRAATGDALQAVHAADSTVEVWVVPTDEGRVAARDAAALLA